jgi:DNA-binding SARP family transcriptional activator
MMAEARLLYRVGDLEQSWTLLKDAEALNLKLKVPLIAADVAALRARILTDRGQFAPARLASEEAIRLYGDADRDANGFLYRLDRAVIELRQGHLESAREQLEKLAPVADRLEAWFPRTLRLYHLGEVERRLGIPGARERLVEALGNGRRLGYDAELRAEFRRSPETLLFLLEGGEEADYLVRLATGLGSEIEGPLLGGLKSGRFDPRGTEAGLAILAEVGGPATHQALESLGPGSPAIRTAIEDRNPGLRPVSPSSTIRMELLGKLVVSGPRGVIPKTSWRSKRALSIFVYLAVHRRRGASKDRLLELFWAGADPGRAEKNFHPTISYARKAFREAVEGSVIEAEQGLYRIDPALVLDVDVHRFESLLSEARGATDPERELGVLERARSLYEGDFLGDRFEGWGEDLRAQLALRYEETLERIGALYFEAGAHDRALPVLRELLARNPYREEVHARAMLCYHHLGDQAAVTTQYRSLEHLLQTELDVEPGPEIQRLYARLLGSP